MPEQGKLLLVESIILLSNEPFPANTDVLMIVGTGGQERTEAEYRSLLRSNGFELTRIILTSLIISIIKAVKL